MVALHDYTKEDNDELTFTEGDIIYIIDTEKPDYIGWHKGVCNGKIGLFKEIYVKMLEGKQKPVYIGWHKGVCNGKIGLFKEIYVKVCPI